MRKIVLLMGFLGAMMTAGAQVQPEARQWMDKAFKQYQEALSFESKSTLKIYYMGSRKPQPELVQQIQYEYQFKRPAMLSLLRTELDPVSLRPSQRIRLKSDGILLKDATRPEEMVTTSPEGAVRIVRDPVQLANKDSVLLEGLARFINETPPDLKFLLGGPARANEFMKELESLRVEKSDDKRIVLKGTAVQKKNRVDLEIEMDAQTHLLLKVVTIAQIKIEDQVEQFTLQMEIQPVLNSELDVKLFRD